METNKKKSYKKPQLQEVKLVPEEAVLAACKVESTGKTNKCYVSSSQTCNNRQFGS